MAYGVKVVSGGVGWGGYYILYNRILHTYTHIQTHTHTHTHTCMASLICTSPNALACKFFTKERVAGSMSISYVYVYVLYVLYVYVYVYVLIITQT
jgi:hypothetical protein